MKKVTFNPVPIIINPPAEYAPSSQDARIEGSFHRSEIAENHIYVQRLQQQMATAETTRPSMMENARTLAYKAALVSGVLALATIACAFFIKNGWAIPVGLASMCVLLFCAAGRKTKEIQELTDNIRQANEQNTGVMV